MSYSFNSCILVGRLTKDPDFKQISEEFCRTGFHLAVNRASNKDQADFIPISLFGKSAKVASKILKKGTPVLVYGRIQIRSYKKDGQTKWMTEVIANNFQILEKINTEEYLNEDFDESSVSTEVNEAIVDASLQQQSEAIEKVSA